MKKIGLICLLLVCCLLAVSCGDEVSAPEGMQDAACANAEYYLFVPNTWVLNNANGISGAYVTDANGNRANVTLTTYLPDAQMTADAYFKNICMPSYQSGTLSGFVLIEEADAVLGGLNARKYVYSFGLGGSDYRSQQVVVVTGTMIYNLTYTALATDYDAHAEDVQAIISSFAFR